LEREILPGPRALRLSDPVQATGPAHGYLSQVRRGLKVRTRVIGRGFERLQSGPMLDASLTPK